MKQSDSVRFEHMRKAARKAEEFLRGLTYEQFMRDDRSQFALVRCIEIIGEAAGRISPEARAAHPELPWRRMIGMRHRVVHDYWSIDFDIVWATLRDDLPVLLAALSTPKPPDA